MNPHASHSLKISAPETFARYAPRKIRCAAVLTAIHAALEETCYIYSLFKFAAENDFEYHGLWNLVHWLSFTGQLHVWTSAPYPTIIMRPELRPRWGRYKLNQPVGLRQNATYRGLIIGQRQNEYLVMQCKTCAAPQFIPARELRALKAFNQPPLF